MLRWARDTSGHPIEDVARKMKKDVETVRAWENGRAFPTYIQLEKLASLYKRPIAMLFFPEPPNEEPLFHSFNTLPEHEAQKIPPRIRYLIRKSKALQMNFSELHDGINPASREIIKDLRFFSIADSAAMAQDVRKYLSVHLNTQKSWGSDKKVFDTWRETIERHGVLVFKYSFGAFRITDGKEDSREQAYSGFSLCDSDFPIICINSSKPVIQQIFTLFSELAHLLMGSGGVSFDLSDDQKLSEQYQRIKQHCTRFASEFLVPTSDFNERTEELVCNEESINKLAKSYGVGKELILRRFHEQKQCDSRYYREKISQWASEVRKENRLQENAKANISEKSKSKRSQNFYSYKGAHLGRRYVEAVIVRHDQGDISDELAAEYLDVSPAKLSDVKDWLWKQKSAV